MTAIAIPQDRYRFRYLIAITVSLASVLELLDTSIVNVAIPHWRGRWLPRMARRFISGIPTSRRDFREGWAGTA